MDPVKYMPRCVLSTQHMQKRPAKVVASVSHLRSMVSWARSCRCRRWRGKNNSTGISGALQLSGVCIRSYTPIRNLEDIRYKKNTTG